jgi:chemotaxis protein MotB
MSRKRSGSSARRRLKTGNEGWLTSYADLMTNLLIFFILIVSASEVQTGKMERMASRISGQSSGQSSGTLAEAQQTVEKTIRDEKLEGKVTARMTDAGLELSFNSGVTFASGRADVRPEMLDPLKKVLSGLVSYSARYQFAVEGHTDRIPIAAGGAYRSNWELASARSLEVRENLESIGVPRDRIRVEAYADTRPLAEDDVKGLAPEEALARARRVVVRLY